MFRNIDLYRDEFDKLNQQMCNFVSNKFLRKRKEIIFQRLDIIAKTGFLHGPQYIMCMLQKSKIQKESFGLQLELGREVEIPGYFDIYPKISFPKALDIMTQL